MKKLKCKKIYGVWYYEIEKPQKYGTCVLDAPVYHLYNDKKQYINVFGSYGDMKYFVETGKII